MKDSEKKSQKRLLKWLVNNEEMNLNEAKATVKCLIGLVEHLKHGHANIVYRMKMGKIVLVRASLRNYEEWFHRPFRLGKLGHTIPYWDVEKDAWRVFSVANLVDWRPTY